MWLLINQQYKKNFVEKVELYCNVTWNLSQFMISRQFA